MSDGRRTLQFRLALTLAASFLGMFPAGCTGEKGCEHCKTFDAASWCNDEGKGQCAGTGVSCPNDGKPCFSTDFTRSISGAQNISIPVQAFRDKMAGLDRVWISVEGEEQLTTTDLAVHLDGKVAACDAIPSDPPRSTTTSTPPTAFFSVRCPVAPDVEQLQLVSSAPRVSFHVEDVIFFEPSCKYLPSSCATLE